MPGSDSTRVAVAEMIYEIMYPEIISAQLRRIVRLGLKHELAFLAYGRITTIEEWHSHASAGILALPLAGIGDGHDINHCIAAVSSVLRSELEHVIGARVHFHDERKNALEVARRLGLAYIARGSIRQDYDKLSRRFSDNGRRDR